MPFHEIFILSQLFTFHLVPNKDGSWGCGLLCSCGSGGDRGGEGSDLWMDPCASVEIMSPVHLVPDLPAGSHCWTCSLFSLRVLWSVSSDPPGLLVMLNIPTNSWLWILFGFCPGSRSWRQGSHNDPKRLINQQYQLLWVSRRPHGSY